MKVPSHSPATFPLRLIVSAISVSCALSVNAQDTQEPVLELDAKGDTSYMEVVPDMPFDEMFEQFSNSKDDLNTRQEYLLELRYDLSDNPVDGVTMFRGKPVQGGVRVRLPEGVESWQALAE